MLPIDASASVAQVKDSYFDPNSLNSIKAMGRDKDPQALKEVAKKFEAMFVQQMLKTMREANDAFGDGNYFDSQTTRFHRDMLDQQMVLNLTSGSGIGLADHFYQQMLKNYGGGMKSADAQAHFGGDTGRLPEAVEYATPSSVALPSSDVDNADALDEWINNFMRMSDKTPVQSLLVGENAKSDERPAVASLNYAAVPALLNKVQPSTNRAGQKASISNTQENFVMLLKPHAEKAAAELNINPDVLIAQVALETGWGRHVIHDKQGGNSFNVFNIKANTGWQGEKVNVSTLEYHNGIATNEKSDFRKYTNYAESFADYVRLMKNNPRYEQALSAGKNSSAYADALQSAGYATDPSYAQKIKGLLNSDAIRRINELAQSAQTLLSSAAITGRNLVE